MKTTAASLQNPNEPIEKKNASPQYNPNPPNPKTIKLAPTTAIGSDNPKNAQTKRTPDRNRLLRWMGTNQNTNLVQSTSPKLNQTQTKNQKPKPKFKTSSNHPNTNRNPPNSDSLRNPRAYKTPIDFSREWKKMRGVFKSGRDCGFKYRVDTETLAL